MSDILELSQQYRISGIACKEKLAQLRSRLEKEDLSACEEIELKRSITLLTAMSRDCLATANYLKLYFERRERLDRLRKNVGV